MAPYEIRPLYVRRCVHSSAGLDPYQLAFWPVGKPDQAQRVAAACGSWRCAGECRRRQGRVTWSRIRDALGDYDPRDVVFAVLTIDRHGTYSGSAWADSTAAYRELGAMSRRLLKRLNRMLERDGGDRVGSRWVAVCEAHRSGWPHLNLVMVSASLARGLRRSREELESGPTRPTERELELVSGDVLDAVTGAGWGCQSTMAPARDVDAVAGYIVKVVGESHDPGTPETREAGEVLAGEVAKLCQIPMAAPEGFRRLRSGRGFLPPRHKNPDITGCMLTPAGEPLKLPRLPDLVRLARAGEGASDGERHRTRVRVWKAVDRVTDVDRALRALGLRSGLPDLPQLIASCVGERPP